MERQPRLGLSIALTRYWKYLIGMFALPVVVLVGGNTLIEAMHVLHVPVMFLAAVLMAGLIVAFVLAVWPCIYFRASFTFAFMAFAAWALGMCVGFIMMIIVHFVGQLTMRFSQPLPAARSAVAELGRWPWTKMTGV
jgi:uncharacterized membrane protein